MADPPLLPGGPPGSFLAVITDTVITALLCVGLVCTLLVCVEIPSVLIQAVGRPIARLYLSRGRAVPRWIRRALQWADRAEELVSSILHALDFVDPLIVRAIRWIWYTLRFDFWALLFRACIDLLQGLIYAAARAPVDLLRAVFRHNGGDSGKPDQ